ncbi:MAG: hypothetical protein GYB31_02835 [Bacteroidetes bacterium]|nr:hypothetical protein [Bacteroidota bacterium]
MTAFSPGMVISESTSFAPDTIILQTLRDSAEAVLYIRGSGIKIDLSKLLIIGSENPKRPDLFSGMGIRVEGGSNITIVGATLQGFKTAFYAEKVDSLQLLDCNFSYNYRQHLKSTREREDLNDWLYYHQNEADEWLRYGAGAYLNDCTNFIVKALKVTGGQNGLLLNRCENGLVYNSDISFNSGIGIGLYRSSHNKLMHNKLDWNVRGYSHGVYARGQDSAGILCYEQSSDNLFAYNSATHSGDGFFLWAGQQTMDSGEGGCNDNLVELNDFSHAPANGIEATFSRNTFANNRLEDCRYGIWAGYSYDSRFERNQIKQNDFGVAIEHGNNNEIIRNLFEGNKIGVKLWERDVQPEAWAFAERRYIESSNYRFEWNLFMENEQALDIEDTDSLTVLNNEFWRSGTFVPSNQLVDEKPDLKTFRASQAVDVPQPMPDAQTVWLPDDHPRGRSYILVDEWGPYNFKSPSIWLRKVEGNEYTFLLLGPKTGNWKASGGEGWTNINQKTGVFPTTLRAKKDPEARYLKLEFEFIGEAFTDRFGQYVKKGSGYAFSFADYVLPQNWEVSWYHYNAESDPQEAYSRFMDLWKERPLARKVLPELNLVDWGEPAAGVRADQFATFARTDLLVEKGLYNLIFRSDDAIRVWLDGEMILDHWDVHTPATDSIKMELGGQHLIRVAHFDAGGLSTLGFDIERLSD